VWAAYKKKIDSLRTNKRVIFFNKIKPREIYGPYKMWRLPFNRTVNIPCVIKWGKSIPHDAPVCGQVTRTHLSFECSKK